jgi:hypothetical protein
LIPLYEIASPQIFFFTMSLYGPPPNLTINEAVYAVFTHYSSAWKSSIGNTFSDMTKEHEENGVPSMAMDSASFSKMCREAPGLAKLIGRTDVDLIFSTAKPLGVRRLDYEHFLNALLEIALRIFPEDDPTIALTNFLARFLFALFDQPPATATMNVIATIYEDLRTTK